MCNSLKGVRLSALAALLAISLDPASAPAQSTMQGQLTSNQGMSGQAGLSTSSSGGCSRSMGMGRSRSTTATGNRGTTTSLINPYAASVGQVNPYAALSTNPSGGYGASYGE